MNEVAHIAGQTWHGRKGAVENAFRYGVDYLLLDAEAAAPRGLRLFGRNRAGLISLHDRDHGGEPGKGRGALWVREVLAAHGLPAPARIELLAQPRVLGHVFNPVSFWICRDEAGAVPVIIAEVTNTYGDRHSYLCHRDDHAPITATDRLHARKCFHVSPFQPVEGQYEFRFDLRADRIGIWIDLTAGNGGVVATLTGPVAPLRLRGILGAALRRPFGSRRVLALIHWQALRLWWKGARFRSRPAPPKDEASR
ncbi:DUF1365 domain-containing protein [Roseovarius sp. MBR-6]|jgi:DUF1365 family protein|uniref:DUF1365 domain-containing protein n=1 Tax=Roseovarius sp. MBR-6 TaxID=3156459 RepID=UPI003398ABF4